MELFMWTVFFLGLCLGVVLAMVWFIFQIRRWQKAHEEKDKATMTCYRADVAVAAHDDRKQLEREISNLKGRIRSWRTSTGFLPGQSIMNR